MARTGALRQNRLDFIGTVGSLGGPDLRDRAAGPLCDLGWSSAPGSAPHAYVFGDFWNGDEILLAVLGCLHGIVVGVCRLLSLLLLLLCLRPLAPSGQIQTLTCRFLSCGPAVAAAVLLPGPALLAPCGSFVIWRLFAVRRRRACSRGVGRAGKVVPL